LLTIRQRQPGTYEIAAFGAQGEHGNGAVGFLDAEIGLADSIHTLDTTTPTVTTVTANPGSGTFGAGAVITLSVDLSEVVAISGGVPTLMLSDGGIASYLSGSGTNTLDAERRNGKPRRRATWDRHDRGSGGASDAELECVKRLAHGFSQILPRCRLLTGWAAR
jgi:hypothetical protein